MSVKMLLIYCQIKFFKLFAAWKTFNCEQIYSINYLNIKCIIYYVLLAIELFATKPITLFRDLLVLS